MEAEGEVDDLTYSEESETTQWLLKEGCKTSLNFRIRVQRDRDKSHLDSVIKPKSKRRNTMKSSTQDNAEGKMHQVKGKIKEIAGKVSLNPDLEAEGKEESRTGKVQEKIGEIKKVAGK
jgi:uncharacterized protein YjbJ (UPF0337 family)